MVICQTSFQNFSQNVNKEWVNSGIVSKMYQEKIYFALFKPYFVSFVYSKGYHTWRDQIFFSNFLTFHRKPFLYIKKKNLNQTESCRETEKSTLEYIC